MNITLIYLNLHLLLNIDVILDCNLLRMVLQFWYLHMKFTFPVTTDEKANFSTLSVVVLKLLQDWKLENIFS